MAGNEPGGPIRATIPVLATLALGIAANAVVLPFVNGALLRDPPFEDVERMVSVNAPRPEDPRLVGISFNELLALRNAAFFEGVGATYDAEVGLSGDGRPAVPARVSYISRDVFPVIRQSPELGRAFTESDDGPGAEPVVILGHELWATRFGADPAIIGQTIRVRRIPTKVVGVMPEGFGFPSRSEIWLPFAALPEGVITNPDSRRLLGFARLAEGVDRETASAEIAEATNALASGPAESRRRAPLQVGAFRPGVPPAVLGGAVGLLGFAMLILLFACANSAYILAKMAHPALERSVSDRRRIRTGIMSRSILVSLGAGALGMLLAWPLIRVFQKFAEQLRNAYWLRFPVDGTVLTYVAGVSLAAGVLTGVVSALMIGRAAGGYAENTAASWRQRFADGTLIVAETSIAVLLVAATAVAGNALADYSRQDVGIDTSGLAQMQVSLPSWVYETPEDRRLFYDRLEDGFDPDTDLNATIATSAPSAAAAVLQVRIDGGDEASPIRFPYASVLTVGNGYFDVVGTRLVEGRSFAEGQPAGAAEAIVNQRFAEVYFPSESALGRRIRFENQAVTGNAVDSASIWSTIVGVVGNVSQQRLRSGQFGLVAYLPFGSNPPGAMTILSRSDSDLSASIERIRHHVGEIDPDLPIFGASTVDDAAALFLFPLWMTVSIFGLAAVIAVLLLVSGVYAVASYFLELRSDEIHAEGGAGRVGKWSMGALVGTTQKALCLGLIVGAAGALAVGKTFPGIGLTRGNLLTVFAAMVLVLGAGLTASLIAGRRAAKAIPATRTAAV